MSKWGLRVYSMADSGTGYISVFQPYYGRETTEGLARPEFPFTSRIVLHLIDLHLAKWPGSGYHLYTDRFYTGYPLALELLNCGVHLTGIVQCNQHITCKWCAQILGLLILSHFVLFHP